MATPTELTSKATESSEERFRALFGAGRGGRCALDESQLPQWESCADFKEHELRGQDDDQNGTFLWVRDKHGKLAYVATQEEWRENAKQQLLELGEVLGTKIPETSPGCSPEYEISHAASSTTIFLAVDGCHLRHRDARGLDFKYWDDQDFAEEPEAIWRAIFALLSPLSEEVSESLH